MRMRLRSLMARRSNGALLITFVFVLLIFLTAIISNNNNEQSKASDAKKSPIRKVDSDADKCSKAAKSLVANGTNFLALDFDFTIIEKHTGGRWKDSPDELRRHVRPVFKCLLNAAINEGMHVGVATFSEQKTLISNVMSNAFPHGGYIPIEGRCCGESHGKNKHIDAVIKDINLHEQNGPQISKETSLLIDDDRRNVELATKAGYKALRFPNDDPWQLIETITSNLT